MDLSHLLEQLVSKKKRRKIAWRVLHAPFLLRGHLLRFLLFFLDLIPTHQHLFGGLRIAVGKHVRMPANELGVYFGRHIVKVKVTGLMCDLGMHHHLQKHVPQLLTHVVEVLLVNSVDQLCGFFQKTASQALVRLLAVPGASVGSTKSLNRFQEVLHRIHARYSVTERYPMPSDKLTEIMQNKRAEVAARVRPVSNAELARLADIHRNGPSFEEALRNPAHLSVISEIKRRSPSAGQIRDLPEASEQARVYYNAGTDAISVLTDEKFFGGTIRDLWEVADLLGNRDDAPPMIRKDFFVHPVQVVEAAEAGARAILIIVRAISGDEAERLRDAAHAAGLDCLFEVHSESEVETALRLGARIIGVNNRDLTRFVTDLSYSEKLLPLIPDGIVKVSESGIHCPEDATRVRAAGADAVLVGEALMKAEDPEKLLQAIQNV